MTRQIERINEVLCDALVKEYVILRVLLLYRILVLLCLSFPVPEECFCDN